MAINQDRATAMVNQIDLRTYYYYIIYYYLLQDPLHLLCSTVQCCTVHNGANMVTHPQKPKYYPWKMRAYLNLLNLLFCEKISALFCFWKVQKTSYEFVVSRTCLLTYAMRHCNYRKKIFVLDVIFLGLFIFIYLKT